MSVERDEDDYAPVAAMAAAMTARIERDGLYGMPVEEVDPFENAWVALDALRALPVEARMEAMGMREATGYHRSQTTVNGFERCWVDASGRPAPHAAVSAAVETPCFAVRPISAGGVEGPILCELARDHDGAHHNSRGEW